LPPQEPQNPKTPKKFCVNLKSDLIRAQSKKTKDDIKKMADYLSKKLKKQHPGFGNAKTID
jgi:hypothetical protein